MTTRELLLSAWDPSPAVLALCVGALVFYGASFGRRLTARASWFAVAVSIFFLAVASPIAVLARGYLFSAHMLQHLLLLLAVPPLVFLSLPPKREVSRAPTPVGARGAMGYGVPWVAGVGAMWIWHQRTLCSAAAASPGVQWLQTASLVMMGLVFWRPILSPALQDRFAPFAAILYLFSACVGCTLLGILLTFSPIEVCSLFLHPVDRLGVLPLVRDGWGLTPAADQQLGGLMMWVPACLVYGAAILVTLARYYLEEGGPLQAGTPKPAAEAK